MRQRRVTITFTEDMVERLCMGIRDQMNFLTNVDIDKKHILAKTLTRLLKAQEKLAIPTQGEQEKEKA